MRDLGRFVAESNVKHYRKLLEQEKSPEKRKIIDKLLREAESTLEQINNTRSLPEKKHGKT